VLGLIDPASQNKDTVPLCPQCHHEIEMINQKFTAVKMEDSKEALTEIFQKFLKREHISDSYIIEMARNENSSCSKNGQVVIVYGKKSEVKA